MNKYATDERKAARQAALLEAVRAQSLGTQAELVSALKRSGIAATQASVSRDVAELGLIKAGGRWRSAPAAVPGLADPELPLRSLVRQVLSAGENLVIIKCRVGAAQQVALALDGLARPELLGTVAGDDTLFAAVGSAKAARSLMEFLLSRIPEAA